MLDQFDTSSGEGPKAVEDTASIDISAASSRAYDLSAPSGPEEPHPVSYNSEDLYVLSVATKIPHDTSARLWLLLAVPASVVLFVLTVSPSLGLLLVLAAFFLGRYRRLFPQRVRRRKQQPLADVPGGQKLAHAVGELAPTVGLKRIPDLLFDGRARFPASTTGKPEQPALAIGPQLVALYSRDWQSFRAIIIHEFYHILMGDLRHSYIARAALKTLAVLTIIVVFFFGMRSDSLGVLLLMTVQAAMMFWICYVGMLGIERLREFYADANTAIYLGSTTPLRSSLTTQAEPASLRHKLFPTHPTATDRLRALDHPRDAMRFRLSWAFASGIATGVLAPALGRWIFSWAGSTDFAPHSMRVAAAVGGGLLSNVLVVGVWRSAHLDLLSGVKRHSGVLIGLATSMGLLLGSMLPLEEAYGLPYPALPATVTSVVTLSICLILFCWWMERCAKLYLRRSPSIVRRQRLEATYSPIFNTLRLASIIIGAGLVVAFYELGVILAVEGACALESLGADRTPMEAFTAGYLHVPWWYFSFLLQRPATYLLALIIVSTTIWLWLRGRQVSAEARSTHGT